MKTDAATGYTTGGGGAGGERRGAGGCSVHLLLNENSERRENEGEIRIDVSANVKLSRNERSLVT